MFHRRTLVINQLRGANFTTLGLMAGLEGFARGVIVGIVPLIALDIFGTKAMVSVVYFLASTFVVLITLNLARIERLLHRRWLITMGFGFLMIGAILLWSHTKLGIAVGIGMRASAASIFSVCLALYIMDYISKQQFRVMESRRMVFQAVAWISAPSIGTYLWDHGHFTAPFLLTVLAGATLIVYFWRLRLGSNPVIKKSESKIISPLKAVPHFFSQKRLRIAYTICISRSAFWVTIFIYGPIYVIEAGFPIWMSGGLLSAASGLLFISPLVSRFAGIYGARSLILIGLTISAMSLIGLALVGSPKPIGLVFWMLGSVGATILDVLGNIPFMRSVRPRERPAMTVVFTTWREGSELLTPAVAAVVLFLAPFWVFYILLAVVLIFAAFLAARLPRRF
ncbi:MAG: MFS transporter [Gammaproteobacteria bacterium]